jgi:hypothetical protein
MLADLHDAVFAPSPISSKYSGSSLIFAIFNGGNNPVNKLPDPVSIPNLLSTGATLRLTHDTEAPDAPLVRVAP